MPKKIHQPHDSLVKKILGDRKIMLDFIEGRFPGILKKIDADSLKLENTNFVDEELSQFYTDLLFSATIRGKPIYLYFLLEHLTNPDDSIHVRMFEYIAFALRRHFQIHGGTRIPPIFPIVFYAGKTPYTGPKCMRDALEDLPTWQELFTTECVKDLARDSVETIYLDKEAAPLELVLRENARRDFGDYCEFLRHHQKRFNLHLNESPYASALTLYMMDRDKHTPEEFLANLRLSIAKEKEIMSALEQIEQRGIKRGKKEGVKEAIRGMYEAGVQLSTICKSVQLSEVAVKAILSIGKAQ